MIGQKNNLNTIKQWRCNKSVPRFIIISGDIGSGRLTLAKVIIRMINAKGIIMGNSIAEVRETIENSYSITEPTCYIFRNADDMKNEAKNALLKVVEEPPNKAYFIMTVQNIDNMLGTIKSRGTVIKMEPYTREELLSSTNDEILLNYCSNIGQTMEDVENIKNAEYLVEEIFQAFRDKSGTQLLKACTNLRGKQTETDKCDCTLFMRVFRKNILSLDTSLLQSISIYHISRCMQELSRSTINKKASVECMLISILDALKGEII